MSAFVIASIESGMRLCRLGQRSPDVGRSAAREVTPEQSRHRGNLWNGHAGPSPRLVAVGVNVGTQQVHIGRINVVSMTAELYSVVAAARGPAPPILVDGPHRDYGGIRCRVDWLGIGFSTVVPSGSEDEDVLGCYSIKILLEAWRVAIATAK